MKSYHNIETRKINGRYIGYSADGRSWRIHGKSGDWTAVANLTKQGSMNLIMAFDTLREISAELENTR